MINGINIKEYSIKNLRDLIGFVPQKATLFAGSIEENIRFGKEEATIEDMEKAANSAAASEFINKVDGRFAHELMQGATNLIRWAKATTIDDSCIYPSTENTSFR